jgi:2-methylisocitrate lyase-like PEP mutase family enzyme
MTTDSAPLTRRADRLRSLHRRGDPLVLVNAWDVASARRVLAAGARAIATSSLAVTGSLGLPDDPSTPLEPMFDAVRRIADAVDVPVTADLLDGYGLDPDDLIDRLLSTGAVGCNLEDSDHAKPGDLLDPDLVADRIAAIRAASARAGVDIVLNARVDSYLHHGPTATPDVLARARRYLDAGADCVYPLRLTEPATVAVLVDTLDAAVNANLSPTVRVADLAAAGASALRRAQTLWIGPGHHLVHYPVSAGELVNVVAFAPIGTVGPARPRAATPVERGHGDAAR